MATYEKKYTYRERAFMAFAWNGKDSVVAALGGVLLMKAKEVGLTEDYIQYGQAMQTTAVLAVVLAGPWAAIMINTLGTKWLKYDGEVCMGSDSIEMYSKGK